ncbi:MAG: SDR family NAD(P)-dependent oxidoreductase [Bacillota bacterium]|jgi:NAD(P)-dependent dehydrogenase (short-subunit alcohol dehydrogenase family)
MGGRTNVRLQGKVALVTGGGRGIGRATALALSEEGAVVAVVARTRHEVESVAGDIRNRGGTAIALTADIGSETSVDSMVDSVIQSLGPIDILVNNAAVGTTRSCPVADYPADEWDRILNITLRGTFLCCRAVLKGMRGRRSGTIVNIGSIAGKKAAPDVSPYCVAKFGVAGLSQALVAENCRHGIRIHTICPGPVDTPIYDRKQHPPSKEVRDKMMKPEDVADAVIFLCSLSPRVRIDEIVMVPNQFPVSLWDYQLLDWGRGNENEREQAIGGSPS